MESKDKLITKTLHDISSVLNHFYIKLEELHGDESLRLRIVEIDKQIVAISEIINDGGMDMDYRKDALNEKMLRDAGIDAVVKDYMPVINSRFNEYAERIELLEEELRIERIRNEEQLKIIQKIVRELKGDDV